MLPKQSRISGRPVSERSSVARSSFRPVRTIHHKPSADRLPQQAMQMGAACAVLAVGVLVYLLDRSTSGAWLIPEWWSLVYDGPPVFGRLGQHLPTFIHVYAFILITASLLAPWKHAPVVACATWVALDCVFELAQLDVIAVQIAARVPAWFAKWPLLDNIAAYFITGRFDLYDLYSIALGAIAAYLTIRFATRHGED